jgi:hypothetical protein
MTVQIVDDVAGGFWLRRFGRSIVVLLGLVLFVAGFVALAYPTGIAALVGTGLAIGDGPPPFTGRDVLALALFTVGGIGGVWLGLRMIRGRRRLGLYLRKFGFADTTRTVSHALSSAVGRSLRLVTLDDSLVTPVGPGRTRRRFAGLITLLAVAGIGWVLYYFLLGPFRQVVAASHDNGQLNRTFGDSIGAAIGVVFLALLVGSIGVVALSIGALGGTVYLASRRAERGASRTLTDEADVDRTARKLARASRRIFGARLVVVAVPTPFWQRAVFGLAEASEVVVIDVSWPTENLVWEVRNIKPLFQGRWVLVGARDRVGPLAWPETFTSHTHEGVLARMLDGEQILAYGASRAEQRQFSRALRRRLHQIRHHRTP